MRRRRLVQVLIALTVLLSPVAVVAPASAATERDCWTSVRTGYGELWVCTLHRNNYDTARAALWSPVTRTYSYKSDWVKTPGVETRITGMVRATDGYIGFFWGGPRLSTPYGAASWGAQYRGTDWAAPRARFGWYNDVTRQFYPDSGWFARP